MKYELTKDWTKYLAYFPVDKIDVYFWPQYAKLYESETEEAVCFACKNENNVFLFPILKRVFQFNNHQYFDFETAYGYGGPIANTDDVGFFLKALQLFFNYCKDNDFICGFTRFHPLLKNSNQFNTVGQLLFDRNTVAIDLTKPEDEIWMNSLAVKNRSTIKKSIKSELYFEADYAFKYLDDFINLYNNTMKKLDADDFFIFEREYYKNWIQNIPNSFLGVVLKDRKVISAAIFFYSNTFGHYHLAGSNSNYLSLNPNNFMIWEGLKELKKKDVKFLHLGGGSNGDSENSLLSFKSRFSPLRFDFNIGKMIFNHEIYEQVCKEWESNNPDKAIKFKSLLLKYKY
ncbi:MULTISPECIES: peptidoglycan bridge formation glycyltransferase FemA/FemB family protein [unclassified Flavobacterium]|uniref:peptidoglycan bridge formation glycyltransferase FemA/FemB family protein n=1 Tax=unclassified Flavobacterium TaxID=196869 RepID=UPI001290E0D6|nr:MULTISPECIES: peptidoglycan bridge formation glycyltransferase FemA/FemB family protein [unclassified Flavobacterium]MQP52070.1 peptidoglycan bridge formation glycyltransferase FemA/FemB family protein [Flavobacterium sp. LMO9]MQP61939.1 peptidoglycan bridge formation glycyltransferase FemA/FemB family protein [Flavobacterium sp. LMO6]